MLCYLGSGTRRYTEKPIKVYGRPYWEFQAVLSGKIAMVDEDGPGCLRSRHLWLSAPGHRHGWTGEPGRSAEVAVFHFLAIPEPLARKVPEQSHMEISLKNRPATQLKLLARQIGFCWQRPGPDMLLRLEHALLELSLMVYETIEKNTGTIEDAARHRVQKALQWFANHLQDNPRLDEVARAIGSSTAHLRRHFHDVMQAPPKKIFDQLRFQRAMQLMADPDTKLSFVCDACGFENPSSFSRAFKTKFGVSPDEWRG